MKCFAAALALIAAFAANASADDHRVNTSTLSKMGLGGMETVSDEAGLAVRGKGFAASAGFSVSQVPGTTAANASIGVSATSNAHADTQNWSVAGNVVGVAVIPGGAIIGFRVTGGASGGQANAK